MSGTTTTFAYNGDGLRDSFTSGGVTTTSTWDILAGVPQELFDGTSSYVYGNGRIAQIDLSGATYYYLPDALGSTMALTDATAAVVDSDNYDAFGSVRSSTGTQANPFTFTGERTDAGTGLEYLRARYYDAATGAFISRDPVPTANRFAYAAGNPVNYTDPSGLCSSEAALSKVRAEIDRLGHSKLEEYWREQWSKALAGAERVGCKGGGMVCWTGPTCDHGHGCDDTVIDTPSDPHPHACSGWLPPNHPGFIPSWAAAPSEDEDDSKLFSEAFRAYKAIGVVVACARLPETRIVSGLFGPEVTAGLCLSSGVVTYVVNPKLRFEKYIGRWLGKWLP